MLITSQQLGRLPKSIEIAMISLGKTNLKEILPIADKIWEASKGAMVNACSVKQESSNENSEIFALQKEVQELKGLMEQMRISRSRDRSIERNRMRNRSASRGKVGTPKKPFCWYHYKFGSAATKCVEPCNFYNNDAQKNE